MLLSILMHNYDNRESVWGGVRMCKTDDLIKALQIYYKCTECYASLYDFKSSEIIMSCDEQFSEIFCASYSRICSHFSKEPSFVFVNGFEMYSGFVVEEEGREYAVVLGPAFTADPFKDKRLYGKTIYIAANGDTEKVRMFLYHASVVDKRKFIDNTSLCYYMTTGKVLKELEYSDENERFKNIGEAIERSIFEMREEGIDNFYPVARQNMFFDCVRRGNVHGVKQLLADYHKHNMFKWSRDSVLNYKLIYTSAMVLTYRISVEAGMAESVSAMIFKSFCDELDDCLSYDEIKTLFNKIILDYTKRISVINIEKNQNINFRPVVKAALEYIDIHLHENITVLEISENCSVSESNLRKKFKEDVGENIIFYIAKQKVSEAKTLLRYSDYSIIEISEYLSFSSQSYFTNVFKKVCGTTPAEYRNSLGINR